MESEQLPKVIKEHKINLLGVDLIVCVLDNGHRVIDGVSIEKFFATLFKLNLDDLK